MMPEAWARIVVLPGMLAAPPASADTAPREETIVVFDGARIGFDDKLEDPVPREGYVLRQHGQTVEAVVTLPQQPEDPGDARRILATVSLRPVRVEQGGRIRPGDPWTRAGSVSVLVPGEAPGAASTGAAGDTTEVELLRFVTGFGGRAVYTQDITALAPLLSGERTIRLYISTFADPAWDVSLSMTWSPEGIGARRPCFARGLFFSHAVTAAAPRLEATVEVPPGSATPRLRILATGHANDGSGANEFVTSTHVLRIDGREVLRFRPWSEEGGTLRDRNPTSGRRQVGGRWVWSSDFDRSGWHPGAVVEPLMVPVPELAPGFHRVELEVLDIRPLEGNPPGFGYWRLSAAVVADEPWPEPGG